MYSTPEKKTSTMFPMNKQILPILNTSLNLENIYPLSISVLVSDKNNWFKIIILSLLKYLLGNYPYNETRKHLLCDLFDTIYPGILIWCVLLFLKD